MPSHMRSDGVRLDDLLVGGYDVVIAVELQVHNGQPEVVVLDAKRRRPADVVDGHVAATQPNGEAEPALVEAHGRHLARAVGVGVEAVKRAARAEALALSRVPALHVSVRSPRRYHAVRGVDAEHVDAGASRAHGREE